MATNTKKYLSAEEYLHDSWQLAAKVVASGWKPDVLIALWRGGAPVGVALHEFFVATGWRLRHVPLKCSSYVGIGQNKNEVAFTLGDEIFGAIHKDDKVLVVDDVFDTGRTAAAVKAHIDGTGAVMRMACVYWKPEKNQTALVPDYFVKDVGLDWLVFPHEIEGLTQAEIAVKDPVLAQLMFR